MHILHGVFSRKPKSAQFVVWTYKPDTKSLAQTTNECSIDDSCSDREFVYFFDHGNKKFKLNFEEMATKVSELINWSGFNEIGWIP